MMLKVIINLFDKAAPLIKMNIPISEVKDDNLFNEIIRMKENINNDELEKFDSLLERIEDYFETLQGKYED